MQMASGWPNETEGPWQVVRRWEVVDGRPECIGVAFEWGDPDRTPEPITTSLLRSLRLGELINSERAHMVATPHGLMHASDVAEARRVRRRVKAKRTTEGRPGYALEHFERVAEVYADAWQRGEPPRKAVADTFSVTPGKAANWIVRARQLGLLPATEQGKARGGARTKEVERGATDTADVIEAAREQTRRALGSTKKGARR